MWTIVGLGNPGAEYERTKHNVGRMTLDRVRAKHDFPDWDLNKKKEALTSLGIIEKESVLLVLPETFMNRSGRSVAHFVKSAKAAERLIVVYDDIDLPVGTMKIVFDRGSGGHKGLESVMRAIKTKKFSRVRVGIAEKTLSGKTKKPKGEEAVLKYLMSPFKGSDEETFKKSVARAAEAVSLIVTEGRQRAMNEYN